MKHRLMIIVETDCEWAANTIKKGAARWADYDTRVRAVRYIEHEVHGVSLYPTDPSDKEELSEVVETRP